MTLLKILEVPDPRLKAVAEPVVRFDDELRQFMDDMLETMYKAPGIGLAAPQVGVLQRVMVVDLAREDEERTPLRLVNPEIVEVSEDETIQEEGCLSLPDQYAEVRRPAAVRLRYQDERGEARELTADGLLARCIQHELDHLNGVLFTDHLSSLKRGMILRKLAKAQKLRA